MTCKRSWHPSPRAAHTLGPAEGGKLAGAEAAAGLVPTSCQQEEPPDQGHCARAALALASASLTFSKSHSILMWPPLTKSCTRKGF